MSKYLSVSNLTCLQITKINEMDSNEKEIPGLLETDEFYKYYLKGGSPSALPQALSIAEQVKKLGVGIDAINHELQEQVLEKHADLLRQGNHATKLESVLNAMNEHVQNLFANAERLRNQISSPYVALDTHTRVLGRLHLASHILRQVNRVQQLSKRLSNTNDPVQKATILYELEQLACDEDLKDIDAVTSELRNIRTQQQKLVQLATRFLNQGIINENETQTITALQIFINLGSINTILQTTSDNILTGCKEGLKAAFETSNTSVSSKSSKAPGRISLTSSQGLRNKVWNEVEKVFGEELYVQCKQIKFLQRTINGLHDQTIDGNLASSFWSKFGVAIQNEIKNSSSSVQQMLEDDYPKLLKVFYEMVEKLNCKDLIFNRQVLEKCENSYLSGSLSRLLDPAQSMFNSEGDVPIHDQIDSLLRIITSELSVSLVEETLCAKICKNVSKSVKMYALKTEQQLETGSEAGQVIGGNANSHQQRNLLYANALYFLQVQIQRILINMKQSLPQTGVNAINDGIEVLTNLTVAIIQPLIASINTTIETIIVTIHLESDWGKLPILPNKNIGCSPYMRELTQFITRVYTTYLSNFDNKEVLHLKCSEVAVRCIELLVRHSSLLRPISQGGRNRLQSDYLHLEHSLKSICPQLVDLGRPYRLLKSMASLVVLKPEEIVAGQASASSVPHSTVLLLLFSFAGAELASPHQNTAWSLPKMSLWLDEHPSESERLDLVAGALQRYETLVRQKNSVNYDPVYPVMSSFLEMAVKGIKNK